MKAAGSLLNWTTITGKISLFCALTFLSQNLVGQVSNVVEGSKWKEVRCNYFTSIFNGVYHVDNWRIEGDTVINDVPYKKLYNHQQDFMFGVLNGSDVDLLVSSSDYYYGAIREENQQVFIYSQDFYDVDAPLSEKMMFDYSVSVGDTVSIWCRYYYLDYTIEEIVPTEMYDGSVRNKFVLGGNSGTGFFGMSFIEGIGSNYGLIGSYLGTTNDQMQHLLCYSINDDIILENTAEYTSNCLVDPIQESCSPLILSSKNSSNSTPTLLVYPNPASDLLMVTSQNTIHQDLTYRLYSPTGSIFMKEKSLSVNLLRIDVGAVPSGMYFLEVELDGSEMFIEKVVIRR